MNKKNDNNQYGYDRETFGDVSQNSNDNGNYNNNNMNSGNNYNYNNANYNNNNMNNGNNYNYNNANYNSNNANYNNANYNNGNTYYQNTQVASITLAEHMAKTFLWMFLGLTLTFATAFIISTGPILYYIFSVPALPFIFMIVEVGLVFYLSARINKLSVNSAYFLFFAYSLLNGVTFSAIFVIYTSASLIFVFGMAALYFGIMALYGFVTKADLSRLQPIFSIGLIVLLVFWGLSLILNLSGFETIICIAGIALFMGLTAFDIQKIKAYHSVYAHDEQMVKKMSIMGALQLYLDFINIFLYLLRLLGRRK